AEKLLAMRRDDVVVDRASIRSVAITQEPWIWIRGLRTSGTVVPLTLAVGTWKFHGGSDFLLIKGRTRAAVVIELDPEAVPAPEFVRVVVSTSRAVRLVRALRIDAPPDGKKI